MTHRHRMQFIRRNTRLTLLTLFLCLSMLTGCNYAGYYARQAHWNTTFQNFPTVSTLNRIAPQDSLFLEGQIVRLQHRHEPLLLVAVSDRYRKREKVALIQIPETSDSYMAFLPKGEYDLFVFADSDNNGDFEWDELVGKSSVSVDPEHSKGGVIAEGPSITADLAHPGKVDFRLSESVRPMAYVYSSLDHEIFDPKNGELGLYNPSEMITRTQGFIFGLEDFNDRKTIVLFVHGFGGTPRDWKYLVKGLDRNRFQPFFFYYPTGLPLDRMGTLLAQMIEHLAGKADNGRQKLVLVAHSMGGLVALSAINKLSAAGLPSSLKLYCSFSTPYAGDESAQKGTEIAPLALPVWRDIAAESEFIRDTTSKPFPRQLPFHLYFSYYDTTKFKLGESSDGSVSLRSQLTLTVQKSATRVLGFNETHVGILNSESVRSLFLNFLDTMAAP